MRSLANCKFILAIPTSAESDYANAQVPSTCILNRQQEATALVAKRGLSVLNSEENDPFVLRKHFHNKFIVLIISFKYLSIQHDVDLVNDFHLI